MNPETEGEEQTPEPQQPRPDADDSDNTLDEQAATEEAIAPPMEAAQPAHDTEQLVLPEPLPPDPAAAHHHAAIAVVRAAVNAVDRSAEVLPNLEPPPPEETEEQF